MTMTTEPAPGTPSGAAYALREKQDASRRTAARRERQERAARDSQPAAVPVSFRITTYWKRRRGEAGLTQMASQRLLLSQALERVLGELPEEALMIDHDLTTDVATIRIDWSKVPDAIRHGKSTT
jgi:hypothetical protein